MAAAMGMGGASRMAERLGQAADADRERAAALWPGASGNLRSGMPEGPCRDFLYGRNLEFPDECDPPTGP
jgi:hypothetical protein